MGKRFLRITFIVLLFFLFVFGEGVFGKLLDLTYLKTNTEVVIIASFTKAPVVQLYSKNGSQTVHFFVINDVFDNHLFQPISAETVEGVQVVSFEDAINLFVYTITPVTATYHVTGSKLYIRFPISCSTKTMTADFVNLKSEVAFKDLAEFFGLKLIIYDGAKGKLVNTKADKATVEQVLRNLLTLTGLSYAYSEDKTLYIGTPEEISKSFATYFHIPEGQVTVENIKKSIGSSVYTTSKSDKSKLFVYGGVKEYKLLADSIEPAKYTQQSTSVAQKPSWNYVSYTASDEQIQGLLEKLKKIYDFDYVVLPELKKVALSGSDSKIAEQFVINLKPTKTETTSSVGGGSGSSIQPTNYKIFDVEYPQRVAEILNLLYPNSGINVVNGKLYVPSSYEQLVKNLLQDPVIANPWKLTLLDIPEDAVKAALQYMSISEKDYIVKSYNDVVYLTLFVNEKTFKNFLEILDVISSTTFAVKSDEEFLKSFNVEIIESFSDGTKLVKGKIKEIERLKKAISEKVVDIFVKVEPTDPSDEIMGKLMGYPTKKADGYWIFTVPESEREKIQEKVKNIRENFGKNIIVSDGKYDQKSLELVQKIYNVEIYVSEDKVIIYGTNAKNAHDFLINFNSENSVIYEIQPVDNALKNMLEENFKVKIYNLDNLAYIVGKQENVQKARQYVNIAEKMAVSVEFVVTPAHIDYLKKVFNVEANYFEDLKKIVISGSSENVLRAASYLKSLTTTIDIFSIRVSEKLNKEAVEKINKLMGLNVALEQVGDMLYLKGTKEEIEKLKEEINKLGDIPELKYEIMSYEESIDSVIKALYKVETYKTKAGYVVYGTQEQLEKVKELVKLFAEGKKYELVSYPEEMDNVVKALNGVETYKVSNGYYVVGTEEQINNVKKLVSEIKVEEEIKVLTTKLEEKEIGTIISIYDNKVRYYKIADKLYLIGKKDSLEKIAKEIEQFNTEGLAKTIDAQKVVGSLNKEAVEKINKLMGLNVTVEQVGDMLYLKGTKEEIEKLKEEINKLGDIPELKYEIMSYEESIDSVIKALYKVETYKTKAGYVVYGTQEQLEKVKELVKLFAEGKKYELVSYPEEMDNVVKALNGVETYKVSNGYYVVGTEEQINNVKKLVSEIKVEEEIKVLTTKLEEKEIGTIVSIYDNKVRYYKIADKLYLIGKKDSLEKIAKEIEQFNRDSEYNLIDGKLLIAVKGKNIGELIMKVSDIFKEQVILLDSFENTVNLRIIVPEFKTFIEYMRSYGVAYKEDNGVYIISSTGMPSESKTQTQQSSAQVTQTEEVIVKDGLISIKASNKNVADIIAQVLSKLGKSYRIDEVQTKVYSITLNNIDYETFKNVFSEWVDIKEIGNVVYVSQISFAKDTKVAVKDGKISVRIDNEPISNVIKSVFESFGYSIVFAKTIDKNATISITDSDLDTFTSVLLNYGIAIKKSGNVYIVDTTEEATKTKTTYTFNVTRGADKVKELIEFYGGKALVNTDAGVVVAYDLNPKNVDDINNMISKISKVRTVLIEAKVVDESLLSSLGYDISTILKSADYVSVGTGGLSVKFKITDFMDIQKLWNQIIDNAEVSLNTSSIETPANTSKGSGKLLANPNILAKSGEEARIFIGDSIPIKVATKSGEQVTEEIKYLEAGIELKITPNINLDDTIELNLYTSVGNFDYSVVIGGLPKQNKREVGTKITLKNGQTLIIGGLAREEVSKSEWKVPILGDLPIIGWLFKGSKEKVEQRNIVIFLTAKIVEQ